MPRKSRPQHERFVVADLRALGLDPQTVTPPDDSVFRLIAWSPSEDNHRLAFEERGDGAFVVALDQRVGGPSGAKMKPLGYTVLRSFEEARILARDLGTSMMHGRAKAMRGRQGRDDYRAALPNPTTDEGRLKRFATKMRKEGFVVRGGADSIEIRPTARHAVIFNLMRGPRYNVQQMDDGDTSKNESGAHYGLAEERVAFLARSLRDGQAAAMRAKKRDDRYRVALPNPSMQDDAAEAKRFAELLSSQGVPTRVKTQGDYWTVEATISVPGQHRRFIEMSRSTLTSRKNPFEVTVESRDMRVEQHRTRTIYEAEEIFVQLMKKYRGHRLGPVGEADDRYRVALPNPACACGVGGCSASCGCAARGCSCVGGGCGCGARRNPAGTTPLILQRAVVAIHEKNPGYSVPRVFAIATAASQRAGYLRQGTREVTAKGRRVEEGYSSEERAGLKRAFEAFAVRENPANKNSEDRKKADQLVERLSGAQSVKSAESFETWLFPEDSRDFFVTVELEKTPGVEYGFYASRNHPKNKKYAVSVDRSSRELSETFYRTYEDGEAALLLALNTALYGRAKALRMRPKGDYQTALPNPQDASCWVDEVRSNPGDFTTPPSDRAFAAEDHLPKVREKLYAQRGSFGQLRGVRLDIPSRMRDLMVVTIHEKPSGGTVVGYDHSAVVKNAEFRVAQAQQAKIMRGEAKAPHAYVSGTLVDEEPSTKGTPISFNPRATHLFLDATNGRPVKSAKRVSIIGKRVYAEGLVHYAPGEAPKKPV